ncbi:MAG: hypothetical protein ACTHJJ_14920 [Intrasporangium sp.]|uniref:hypothetical protein n=1 Tax=Intrasporangium sp. TaxID=1925024 RepID=UPI003F7F254F
MSTSATPLSPLKTRGIYAATVWVNLAIMLFPPIHLLMAGGSMNLALVYFIGSPLVLIASMLLLTRLDPNYRRAEEA